MSVVVQKYPRDRVALNQLARVLFLQREYAKALDAVKQVLQVDPEDIQAHYTAMLSHQGLGNQEEAQREQKLFMRFKADESAQAITGGRRLAKPEENNERQQIHAPESVNLPPAVPGRDSSVAGAAPRARSRAASGNN